MYTKHYSEVFAFLAIVIVLFGLFKPRDTAAQSKWKQRTENLNKRVKEAENDFVRETRLGAVS